MYSSSRSKLRILRLLSTITEPLSGREVARRTGSQWRAVYLALRELVALGVVVDDQTRGQAQFRLNRDHGLVEKALVPLFDRERQWAAAVKADLRRWVTHAARDAGATVLWAAIFGSTGRGDDTPGSDLDLVVVLEGASHLRPFTDALQQHAAEFQARLGPRVSPTTVTLTQLRRLEREKSPLVKGWRSDAYGVIGPPDLDALLP